MKKLLFLSAISFVAFIVLFISCEKEPTPITPTPFDEEPDYRLRWVGTYLPVQSYEWHIYGSVNVSIVEDSDSLLHIDNWTSGGNRRRDVAVHDNGVFEWNLGEDFIVNGYFYGEDSMHLYNRYPHNGYHCVAEYEFTKISD